MFLTYYSDYGEKHVIPTEESIALSTKDSIYKQWYFSWDGGVFYSPKIFIQNKGHEDFIDAIRLVRKIKM